MNTFVQKYQSAVKGALSGFDRLVFQGTLMPLCTPGGLASYFQQACVLLKEFGTCMRRITDRVKQVNEAVAERHGQPAIYLSSSRTSKEDIARSIAERNQVKEGLVCVLKCVEPIWSYEVGSGDQGKLVIRSKWRKGLQYYHYCIDPDFGLMHARISSWLPLQIRVCVNGRAWLRRKMDAVGMHYVPYDNTFLWIEDVACAQGMMDQMLRTAWEPWLDGLAQRLNPAHREIFRDFRTSYYWTVPESEWATDVMFQDRMSVERLYPLLTRGAMEAFGATEVLRFLGHCQDGNLRNFRGEAVSDLRRREPGLRVKFWVKRNSVKVYDKGSVLRVETTINDPSDFKVYRPTHDGRDGELKWQGMRRGVADLYRRSEVSEGCNERTLNALATLNTSSPLVEVVRRICRPSQLNGRRIRAIHPWSEPDTALLRGINDGIFFVNGFRNRDLMKLLHPEGFQDATERRRASARITRQLRMLRAHKIIKRVVTTYRYQVTEEGRQILTAILQYQSLKLNEISEAA